jgi:hypothetical protein
MIARKQRFEALVLGFIWTANRADVCVHSRRLRVNRKKLRRKDDASAAPA